FADLRLQRLAAELELRSRWCADVGRQRLAGALAQSDRLVQEQLGHPARGEPGESAAVRHATEGESPIAGEPMKAEIRGLRRRSGHRLDRIPHQLANTTNRNHRAVTLNHFAPPFVDAMCDLSSFSWRWSSPP